MKTDSFITDDINCPQCGYPAVEERNYVNGENRCTCSWCGYGHVKGTEDGKDLFYKGCGSVHRKNKAGHVKIELLRSPLTILQRDDIYRSLGEDDKFYVWDESSLKLENLKGSMPLTIDEIYEEQKQEAMYYASIAFDKRLSELDYVPYDTD